LASNANDFMTIDPNQLPRRVEIDVPERVLEWVRQKAAETGRDPDELLLELLDRGLQQE
jgi:predicted DNA binding CopG/RHH family protein